ncbi:hypothetical protein PMIN06_011555 [Paraphaeosphaeria minitans]
MVLSSLITQLPFHLYRRANGSLAYQGIASRSSEIQQCLPRVESSRTLVLFALRHRLNTRVTDISRRLKALGKVAYQRLGYRWPDRITGMGERERRSITGEALGERCMAGAVTRILST